MEKRWDILGIGAATVDDLIIVDTFPAQDSKQEALAVDRQGGGLVTTATVAAARLGARCAYFDLLGDDDLSQWVEADLQREGIDTSPIVHRPGAQPIHAFVMVAQDAGTRTILYTMTGRVMGDDDLPDAEVIRAARVLLLDDVNTGAIGGITRAVETARAAGMPVVADIELTHTPALIEWVDHLIVSAAYAMRITQTSQPADAARSLWHDQRSAVIVTCGADGCWALTAGGEPKHHPTFPVQVVDTTGCGDVFHGAYAAGLAQGLAIDERIQLASACAALKATQLGGRRGIPTQAKVDEFLRERGGNR